MRTKKHSALLAAAVIASLGLLASSCEPEGLTGPVRDGVTFTLTTEEAPDTKGSAAEPVVIPMSASAVNPGPSGDLSSPETFFLTVEEEPMSLRRKADPATKATLHPDGALKNTDRPGLVAFTYDESNATPDKWTLYTAETIPLQKDDAAAGRGTNYASNKWIPSPAKRLLWPGEGFVRFFALAPYDATEVRLNLNDGEAPKLSYKILSDVTTQEDLLVSSPSSTRQYAGDPGWRMIDVQMKLAHALTGIRFRIADGLTVDKVEVIGVYDKGDLDLSSNPLSWSNQDKSVSEVKYSLTDLSTTNGKLKDNGDGFNVTTDDNLLLLMPQTLPENAKIAVTVSMKEGGTTIAGSERTITADISGQEWKLGTLVTYTISSDGSVYVLKTNQNELRYNYTGGSQKFKVQSYKIGKDGSKIGVDWKLQAKMDGIWTDVHSLNDIKDRQGNAWIYSYPLSGEHGNADEIEYEVVIAAMSGEIIWNTHTSHLRALSSVGSPEAPVDLSMISLPVGGEGREKTRTPIAQSTANCYVVDRPGWYKIPMVYGNALREGVDNKVAYESVDYSTYTGATPATVTKPDHSGDGVITQLGCRQPIRSIMRSCFGRI